MTARCGRGRAKDGTISYPNQKSFVTGAAFGALNVRTNGTGKSGSGGAFNRHPA